MMANYQNIDAVINNTRSNLLQKYFHKDSSIPLNYSSQTRRTLELLNTTNDINLQTKLFSVLSSCLLLNNDATFEEIIKYSAVYDRINNVLAKGLPRKAVHALNFLSTLLCVDAEDDGPTKRRTLALYAKNMTRVSGCLATMSDMFSNCMMYHDTWNALCQSLAAACSGSDLNQSYCTHLIPVCIQRCSQTNVDILMVLQSLLLNHNRNMELFINCNGLSIFTRELLHYDKCLQLLITVVQCPDVPSLLLRQVQIVNDLREFSRLYGPSSQIGQKAMIILNHIGLRSRELSSQINQARAENIPDKIIRKENCDKSQTSKDEDDELNDTATLIQKVMKEVYRFKQNQVGPLKKAASKADANYSIRSTSTIRINPKHMNNTEIHITNTSNKTRELLDQQRKNRLQYSYDAELSFSFLQNYNNGLNGNTHIKTVDKSRIFNKPKAKTDKVIKTRPFVNTGNELPHINRTISNEKITCVDPKDFRPIFSSTPKREETSRNIDYSKNSIRKSSFLVQSQSTLQMTRKMVKRNPKKIPRCNNKISKNTSFSSRFFGAINESCMSLVKTVTSIFKKNESTDFSKDRTEMHASRADDDRSCSFSFLNYMQKRDTVLSKIQKTKYNNCTVFSLGTDSCETCDTQALQKKMARNEHLKQTVKKLKLGINLYGCDFKRISRTMWPRESYMTPIVLYNLYRKLLKNNCRQN